ncbi:hypothetical protein P154DRAFT_572447 [Amniculicola lignicola CBS 123094]|uniref:RING-type domain-containing protein n=1 Tax=Amniculicola lignicola CBS 123094 TaxID=1392246 RepID=A0A6A5WQ36_9PLEO|nr:hypothetical protein P154DRAFT_572447 [Amniculicola lignicola CBS 123094]
MNQPQPKRSMTEPEQIHSISLFSLRFHYKYITNSPFTKCGICRRPYSECGTFDPAILCRVVALQPCGHILSLACFRKYCDSLPAYGFEEAVLCPFYRQSILCARVNKLL